MPSLGAQDQLHLHSCYDDDGDLFLCICVFVFLCFYFGVGLFRWWASYFFNRKGRKATSTTKTRPRQKTKTKDQDKAKTTIRTWSSRRSPSSAGFFVLILIKVRNFAIIHWLAPTAVPRVLLRMGWESTKKTGAGRDSPSFQPMMSVNPKHRTTPTHEHKSCATRCSRWT